MVNICFDSLRKATKDFLNKEEAKEFFDEIKSRSKEKQDLNNQSKADSLNITVQELINEEAKKIAIQKRHAYLNIAIRNNIDQFVNRFGDDKLKGLLAYMDGTQRNVKDGRFSSYARQKSRTEQLYGSLLKNILSKDLMNTFHDINLEKDLANEMFEEGSVSNKKIKELSKAIKDTYEESRRLLNKAGSDVGNLSDFIASQTHDAEKLEQTDPSWTKRRQIRRELVNKFGYKEAQEKIFDIAYERWKNYILPRLDEDRTFDQNGVTDREKYLRATWDNLRTGNHYSETNDFNGKLSFARPGNKANKISAHRKLHFKDGTAWYEYNKKYGSGSVQTSILHTLRSAGKNIGLLETFGPNPKAMFENVLKKIKFRC